MRDTSATAKRDRTGEGEGEGGDPGPTRAWRLVLIACVSAVALTAAVGGAAATTQESARDPLTVATDCVDGTSEVTLENPTDERIEATLTWDGEQSSVRVSSAAESTTGTVSEMGVETTRLGLATEQTGESLTAAVSAGGSVTVEGLADGTYNVSATADGEDVPVAIEGTDERTSELRIECGADAANDSSGGETADNRSSTDRESAVTERDGETRGALEGDAASIDGAEADSESTDTETDDEAPSKRGANGDENRTDDATNGSESDAGDGNSIDSNETESDD